VLSAADLSRFQQMLVSRAGGYLRNPIRIQYETCAVCAAPVDGYLRCAACNQHHGGQGDQLAEAVAPLTSAIGGTQSGYLMRGYKQEPAKDEHKLVVALTTWAGLGLHTQCAGRLAGRPVTHWSSVPSLPAKPAPHPFHKIASVAAPGIEIPLVAADSAVDPRTLSAEHFGAMSRLHAGSHVLLLDDTWTKGGHAQSAVLALRRAGAEAVSVMVTGRWINPEFGSNAKFVREHLNRDYDPTICPWTGGDCP
jgi:hypothetical protein